MLARTDQPNAPWSLIAAESKRYARVDGDRDGDRADRGGHARVGDGAAAPLDDGDGRGR